MKTFFAKMWEAFLAFCSGVAVILACNPLTMFLFQLFAPEYAARFVREFIGFNDFWRRFYTKCSLKWPLMWSKYWITLGNLKSCSVRKQVAYYWAHRTLGQVLRAMSPEAQVALVRKHPDWIDHIDGQMRITDEMFAEWMNYIVREEHKPHPYLGHWSRVYASLSDHLKTGKLPFSQVMLLLQTAVAEYDTSPLMNLLNDYIERFGLTPKQLKEMAQYMCDNLYYHDAFGEDPQTEMAKEFEKHKKFDHFFNALNERQINYDQRVFTRSQRGTKRTEAWKQFCESTNYICIAAQREMDIEQYKVFHAAGKMLRSEAIVHFLKYPDRKLHRLVFLYEPLEIFEEKDLKLFISKDANFKAMFDEKMANHQ